MFRVLVVDDEPGALQHICNIIQMKCPEYKVVGTAENGKECLEWVRGNSVDLVITDVRMPIMNGIETVTALKQEFPELMTIIVSGYQEFEYAQGAIKAGASDYILKPVVPADMQKTLAGVAVKLRRNHYHEKIRVIHGLCNGEAFGEETIRQYFPHQSYYGAIVRRNGLPKRFGSAGNLEIYSDINEMITVYGRDEMEVLYLIPQEMLLEETFEAYLDYAALKCRQENDYITMVYKEKAFCVLQMQEIITELYRRLDMASIVGISKKVNIDLDSGREDQGINPGEISTMLLSLEYLVKEQQYDKTGKELRRLYLKWQSEQKPQLWLEYVSRQILYLIANNTKMKFTVIECEYMMEDAFYYAASTDELIDNLFEIMLKHLKGSEESSKVDSPEFFAAISQYLMGNLADAITLQSVCKKFAVSQTYLSKLFRKYEHQSFNRYLTDIRMKRAIEIMKADRGIFVKDVAAMVGYGDQFYFSRIFRSCIGKCPSEYLEEL